MMGTGTGYVPVSGVSQTLGGIGTCIGKIWYRKKVSEPVSVEIGIGKKSRNRYRKNLVPKKYQYWYWKCLVPEKKVLVSVTF